MKRAMNKCHQEEVKACQRQARLEIIQVTKMVPRLPSQRFRGPVNLSVVSVRVSETDVDMAVSPLTSSQGLRSTDKAPN